jgi:thiol-disulfide isomerase/thioredoxin
MFKRVALLLTILSLFTSSLAQTPSSDPKDLIGRTIPSIPIEQWITIPPLATGKWTLLEFWATWCGYCEQMTPRLNTIQATLGHKLAIVAMSNEDPALIQSYIQAQKFTYPVARIAPGIVSKTLGVTVPGIPYGLLLDAQGTVRWAGTMPSQDDSLLEYLQRTIP